MTRLGLIDQAGPIGQVGPNPYRPQAPAQGAWPSAQDAPPWYENSTPVYVLLVIVFPVGLYGLWKSTLFSSSKKWGLTALTVFVWLALASSGGSGGGSGSGGSSTFYQDGCTYYRDSSCNVIARDCE